MKRDDRDITCEQDYTPLSNAELVAHIEQYARLMHNAPLNGDEMLADIIDPARVLLARVEAAEATREQLADRLVFEMQQREALAARVAELEAQLATRPPGYLNALDARDEAQSVLYRIAALVDVPGNAPAEEIVSAVERAVTARGWRPIGEPAPKGEIEVKMRCAVGDDGQIYKTRTDIFVGWWTVADDSEWRPLPPLPQEPTP